MSFINTYLKDFNRVSQLYEYNPAKKESFSARAEVLAKQNYPERAELVQDLLAYNRGLGCGIETENNLKKLLDVETLAVVTGQQAGLFTGPVYTIYKACTAVVMAEKLSKQLGRDIVPIFWIASEDHDFEEINHIYTPSSKGKPEKISLPTKPFGKPSIGEIALPVGWEKLIEAFSYHTTESEYKAEVVSLLKRSASTSKDLAGWFARIMTGLFRDYGLVFLDPMQPGVRKQLTKGVQRALQVGETINNAVSEKEEILKELGFTPQIVKDEQNVNLFIYINGQREALYKAKDKFYINSKPELSWSYQELIELVEEEPAKFSPNVVLRPIFQDLILPTLCYVAGPGEIAYYAQLKEVYPLFNLSMPIIYPRKRLTLIEPEIVNLMDIYGISFKQVQEGLDKYLEDHLERSLEVNIDGEINRFISKLELDYEELLKKLMNIDNRLETIGEHNLSRINYQIEYLRKKAWQKHRRKNKEVIQDFKRIENYFSWQGKAQERLYNFMAFLVNLGPSIIKDLLTEVNYEDFNQQAVTLGRVK